MFYAVVGLGPNSVEIPALIFSSKEKAEKHLEANPIPHLLVDQDLEDDNYPSYYTHYYGGCGECSDFKIVPVEEGKPFVGWDLD